MKAGIANCHATAELVPFEQVLAIYKKLFIAKQKLFAAQVEKHMKIQSSCTKQLIALLKSEIQTGFEEI